MRKDAWKEHLKRVNARLEKVQEQAAWSMHDAALRQHMRQTVQDAFMPSYAAFWERYQAIEGVKAQAKYFKCGCDGLTAAQWRPRPCRCRLTMRARRYSPADLQAFINDDLFAAKGAKKASASSHAVPKALKNLAIGISDVRSVL